METAGESGSGHDWYEYWYVKHPFFPHVPNTWVYDINKVTGNASAAESPFGGIKESGYGKESGKDVAVNEYLITKTGTLSLEGHF